MSKEILRFRGLSLNKDEQSADHGELSLCAGVELHDGALRPSVLEGSNLANKLTVPAGDPAGVVATLLYVHVTASYKHFIGKVGGKLYWFKEDGSLPFSVIEHSQDVASNDVLSFVQQLIDSGLNEQDIHYIKIDDNTYRITWNTEEAIGLIHEFIDNDTIISVNSVGNTLVVMTSASIHYILWKDDVYKYLGTEIPFVEISFRPSRNYASQYDRASINNVAYEEPLETALRKADAPSADIFPTLNNTTHKAIINSGYRTFVTESVWALINQTNHKVAEDGHFYAPFLIRYCYRLYDGSMVMHSAPVFMNVCLPQSYNVLCLNIAQVTEDVADVPESEVDGSKKHDWPYTNGTMFNVGDNIRFTDTNGHVTEINGTLFAYKPSNVGIMYLIDDGDQNETNLASLKNDWGDIVKSIDIFVSPMMTREKTGVPIEEFVARQNDPAGVRNNYLDVLTPVMEDDFFTWRTVQESHFDAVKTYYDRHHYRTILYADIPLTSVDEYLQRLKDCSTFYKLASFDLETGNVNTSSLWKELSFDKSIVPNITSQELMKDDYHTHCRMMPMSSNRGMYIYNHRVNLYGMQEKLFSGFDIGLMCNLFRFDLAYNGGGDVIVNKIVVELNTDEGRKHVIHDCVTRIINKRALYNIMPFYPDSRAVKMTIYLGLQSEQMIEFPLERSNFLNGAVSTNLMFIDTLPIVESNSAPSVSDLVPMPNKVITSEVDNPYYYPVEGRNTVGTGNIRGIAAVTRALSQGQVGDHDLVVFATDGIWVMKVSSEGTYGSIHNISREVCTNPKSICQLDQSVVFATERSLSRFVESNVVSMSDVLDGPIPDLKDMLPGLSAAVTAADATGTVAKMLEKGTPAVRLFNDGQVFYDYAGSRVIVFPAAEAGVIKGVAMIYSIRDQAWSTMPIPDILAVVPGYPSPFVQLTEGNVVTLDKAYNYRNDGADVPGLIITRTLTFSDTMDVIRAFTQYSDSETAPMLFLYGSNDQRTWQSIGMSGRRTVSYLPGSTYRFFRAAVFLRMKPSEEYQQLMLEVVNKYAKL